MIIGVDVGPTNTDAVLLDDTHSGALGHDVSRRVLASVKVPTLPDDAVGSLVAAVSALPTAPRAAVSRIAVGLRVAARAVAERRGLARVGVLRIGGEAADAVRPLFGWPAELREAVCAGYANVPGGTGLDPHGEEPLDRAAVARFAAGLAGRAEAFAVTGVFSPADGSQEREAAEILRAEAGPDIPVLLSGEIGSLGLIERERATVLDAALSLVAARITDDLTAALPRLGLAPGAAVLVTRHDGTLMSLDRLRRQPGPSLGSGPACAIRGAGLLAGVRDAVVADIGGRQARVGVLTGGYPREAGGGTAAGARIPDLLTVDLAAPHPEGRTRSTDVHPASRASVMSPGTPDAYALGSDTPGTYPLEYSYQPGTRATRTLGPGTSSTPESVGTGNPGAHPAPSTRPLGPDAHRALAEAADRMQPAAERLPLLLVGGGADAIPDRVLAGFDVVRPEHGAVAGAFGAAASPVGGHYERIVRPGAGRAARLDAVRAEVRELARASAVRAGADPRRVRTELDPDLSVPYLPGAVLLRARAVGPPLPL
ncbi:hydantoinase/oxoprolinase N-terminal domain-containing protein [Streptomyces sp. NPDC087512]|uniref:hydantoinase/oxoprolinase N-terminal domain-containing protein n=1 Tax=Streptomyces sp. NPDC087512 TaxID=3155059 RepID=UPI0034219EC8